MKIRERLRRLMPGRSDRDLESEMRFHLDMEAESGRRRGLPDDEARRQAVLRVGGVSSAMEEARDQRTFPWLAGTVADLRHACVGLFRQPGFLAIATTVLAVAVAANTLIFTVVNGVLLKPLPYRDPGSLVRVFEWSERNPKFPLSILNYLENRRQSQTLQSIGLYTGGDMELMHGERPERLTGVRVTHDFYPTLGVQPILGRNFLETELKGSARVVILGHAIWRSRFHSDRSVVGQTIRLNRESWTVIGVMPLGFQHPGGSYRSPLQGETVDVWCPLGIDIREQGLRYFHFTNAIARLKPEVPLERATQDLNRVVDDLTRRFPDAYTNKRARVEPLAAEVVGQSAWTVQLIMAAGLIVMIVACINIAGLCVARVVARQTELAIRQALGGGRWRLIRAVLAENLVLGALGGITGLLLAVFTIPVLRSILPTDFPRLHEINIDLLAGAFAVSAALLTSVVAGIVPAFRQTMSRREQSLSRGIRVTEAGHGIRSLRGVLVVAEVALACVLCFGAALLVRSGMQLATRDHGFQTSGVTTFQLAFPREGYNIGAKRRAFISEALRRWREIPGVSAVGAGSSIPWTGYDDNTSFDIPGRPAKPGESIQARYQKATPGYFEALRWPLRRGRLFDEGDHADAKLVVVINDVLARRYFEGIDPVDREIKFFGRTRRIVGVVADVRDYPAALQAEPAVWMPEAQEPDSGISVVVRSSGDPLAIAPRLRETLATLDRELPMAELRTLDAVATAAQAERRFAVLACQAFAGLGLLLAAIGIYGLLTYVVQQRRKEIGIRMALGATRATLLWMVTGSGLRLGAAGVVAGLLFTPLAGRAMTAFLYGVSATDTVTLIVAPVLMVMTALVASAVPGWIAARSQPMSALRDQ
ncbi:MAG TPA: ABC transporter permease [Bryobacteraceae bacterium]|nr:ABC transporter permease [Bryobacteraceae bacterium]